MKKKYILIYFLIFICGLVNSQNVTFDDNNGVSKGPIIASVEAFVYVLVNLGLAIGAVPTAKRIFSGEPGSWKGVVAWLGGIIMANVLIDPIVKAFGF